MFQILLAYMLCEGDHLIFLTFNIKLFFVVHSIATTLLFIIHLQTF